MATKKKLLQAAAGAAGGGGLNVEEVFSTYLYDGTGSAQTITNGIDLSGEGGLVWIKERDAISIPVIYDTERGVGKLLRTNDTNAETDLSASSLGITAYNSNGFSLGGTTNNDNDSGINHASWTFRKAPKFFDVVSWTGDGNANRQIPHNLDTTVGSIFVKCTSATYNWVVYHRSRPNVSAYLRLNTTDSFVGNNNIFPSEPTSTHFEVDNSGGQAQVNASGQTYVAYLFAHNDGDGDFGPTGDQDIIKCGSYTGNGSTDGPEIDLGFEPQWLLIKVTSGTTDQWVIFDTMRGLVTGGADNRLFPNLSNAEGTGIDYIEVTPTGFKPTVNADLVNRNTSDYIYIAIRRGPMAVPESATDVFQVGTVQNNTPKDVSPAPDFPVDFVLHHAAANSSTGNKLAINRLASDLLYTNLTGGAYGNYSSYSPFDHMDNVQLTGLGAANGAAWMWRRAPNYFDVVAYTGTGSARTVSHNLGVAPEMMWIKRRDAVGAWNIYHSALGATKFLQFDTDVESTASSLFNDTEPTDSVFTVGTSGGVNASGGNLIAYLFASLDGVSKVGSYTGNGSTQNIDCGFSSGARFVLIKSSTLATNWYVFDTERGIVAGNDAELYLDTTTAEATFRDTIDPYSSGFSLTGNGVINNSGQTYIFYAIA